MVTKRHKNEIFFSETWNPRTAIFDSRHYLANLYKICPWGQNRPRPLCPCLTLSICLNAAQVSFPGPLWPYCLIMFYRICSLTNNVIKKVRLDLNNPDGTDRIWLFYITIDTETHIVYYSFTAVYLYITTRLSKALSPIIDVLTVSVFIFIIQSYV